MEGKILLTLLIIAGSIQVSIAIKCYVCETTYDHDVIGGDLECFENPSSDHLTPDLGDIACTTRIETKKGVRSIRRFFAPPTNVSSGDTTCEEGPLIGTEDPEKNYVKGCLCYTDACNNIPYEKPPPMESALECYQCSSLDGDEDCAEKVPTNYLKGVPATVDRTLESAQSPKLDEQDVWLPIEPYSYHVYCTTSFFYSATTGQSFVERGWEWFHNNTGMDGRCVESRTGVRRCYCNTDRCNDHTRSSSGATWNIDKSFTILALAIVLSRILPSC